jgi:hypothetical protein
MAGLKAKIGKLEDVEEGLRARYKQHSDGSFYLEIEGLDDHVDVGELRRAKEYEHKDATTAKAKVIELSKRLETIEADNEKRLKGMLPAENIQTLETSYKEKLKRLEDEHTSDRTRLSANLTRLLVDNKAQELAAALAIDAKQIPLLLPHIRQRMTVEMIGDEATTRILDKAGKPSAATLDDLKKEFLADPAFAPVVLGNKASGSGARGSTNGGAGGGGPGGGATGRGEGKPNKKLADMKPEELADFMKAKKEASGQQ